MKATNTLSRKKIVVLGGYGAMGKIIVRDLAQYATHADIVIAGRDEEKARVFMREAKLRNVSFVSVDVNDVHQTAHALNGTDVCVNAVQYELNEAIMRACLLAKCHYVDLGGLFHVTRKQLKWHKKFKREGLLAVLGMGAAPGVTNILAKIGMDRLSHVDAVHIRVGGRDFTKIKNPPPIYFSYSPKTVLEEHTVSPMVFTRGTFKSIAARSLTFMENFGGRIGLLKTMATLHSEVATLPHYQRGIRECTFAIAFEDDFEKKVSFLVEAGFASPQTIDFTAKILSAIPKPHASIRDIELLRARVSGKRNGKPCTVVVDGLFKSSTKWNVGAGDIDTGVPPSIVAQMIAMEQIPSRGVLPPENCVPVKPFIQELGRRGMKLKVKLQ